MNLAEFADHLQSDGALVFRSADSLRETGETIATATLAIERLDARRRLELAHDPPTLNREQSLWAARLFYRAGSRI